MSSFKIIFKSFCLIFLFLSTHAISEILNKIEITGNNRISDETIKLFISIDVNEQINDFKIKNILKKLYETNFFQDITVKY